MNVTRSLLHILLVVVISSALLCSCHPRSQLIEPTVCYTPQKRALKELNSPFEPLTPHELNEEWGREHKIGLAFALDGDYYRAITALRRAQILTPLNRTERRLEQEYAILLCYALGKKYCDAIEFFQESQLKYVTSLTFPPFRDMLVILYECYDKTDQPEKAHTILQIMDKGDPDTSLDLKIFSALDSGNISAIYSLAGDHPQKGDLQKFVSGYCRCAKSVSKAQTLNAILPGAGYYYVGQKKTALTSLVINASFIAAAAHFFCDKNWGAAVITTSLELGWYFGGINGAGLAAKQYNEWLYQDLAKETMIQKRLFPVLMLETSF